MFGLRVSQFKRNCSAAALAIASSCVISSAAHADGPPRTFDIPQESASKSLIDFSKQSGLQIMAPYDKAAKITTPAVKGEFTPEQALAKLLHNSGLEIASRTDTTIYLRVAARKVSEKSSQVAPTGGQDQSTEVVVTGTRIHDVQPASPVHTVTRADIDASGYSDIGDVVRSLPENFGGGQNPGVIAAAASNNANSNSTNASTINLRGLGSDATLVLLDGHRLTADGFYQGADISGVPLAAVQRIEVVPDGASALYGSDAVAGVVNIILRKDFDGSLLSSTWGNTTQGGGLERQFSLLSGHSTDNWFLLGDAEYARQDGVTASQRDFTSEVSPATTLWQPQTRRSLFLRGGTAIGPDWGVSFDAMLSDRNTTNVQQYGSAVYTQTNYTPEYNFAVSADASLGGSWKFHLTTVTSGSHNSLFETIPAYDYSYGSHYMNGLDYVEASIDGLAFQLPSGPVKVAAGGGYRQERWHLGLPTDSTYEHGNRNVSYIYGEAEIPLVAPSVDRFGLNALDINVSGRSETYSDFGSTTNPKIGIRYIPFEELTVRGTWGKSFKAPSFFQMYQGSQLYVYNASDYGYAGPGLALETDGSNPNLKPEKSTSITLGADFSPSTLPSLKVSATVFNIDYRDRIVLPISNYTVALTDPTYAPFVTRSPTAAQQAQLIAQSATFTNFSGSTYEPGDVVAVVENEYTNATAQRVVGADLAYREYFISAFGRIDAFANATWTDLRQQTLPTMPMERLSGTIFNVPKFKARGGASWSDRGWNTNLIANFVSGEIDNGVDPAKPVASWTTVDANLSYDFGSANGPLRKVKVTIAATNLFDKAPPRAASPAISYAGVYVDSTNASVIGRFLSISVSKAW